MPCFSDSDLPGSCFDILFRGSLCTLWFDVEGNHVVSSRLFSRGCFRGCFLKVVCQVRVLYISESELTRNEKFQIASFLLPAAVNLESC